jgi:GT2 family glycosyltransferase
MPKATLIISVYRKKEELELIFRALAKQSEKDFGVIAADDDSGNDIPGFVSELAERYGISAESVSHTFSGFGKNIILNKAVLAAKTDYLIFIDGDCVPHHRFIEGHLSARRPNTVLCGRRVMLGENISGELKRAPGIMSAGSIPYRKILASLFEKPHPTYYAEEGLYLPMQALRALRGKCVSLSGCNFSLPKALMEKINGFDEDYTGPGIGEDSDLEFRLRLAGADFLSVRNLAVLYHIYHKLTVESNTNYSRFHDVAQKSGTYFCKNGLIKQ